MHAERVRARLAHPPSICPLLDRRACREAIEGRIDLDCVELLGVKLKPLRGRAALGVENTSPMAVAPA
jgi:hypothetical protein